jgi:O-antigen/teichoic acid export membrane protein
MPKEQVVSYKLPPTGKGAFVKHYGSTVLVQGFLLGLGMVTGILTARMLGPAGRGEYVAITIWPMAISTFLAFGINHAAVFNLGQRTLNVSEVATAVSVIGLIQGALTILIYLLAAPFALAKYSLHVQHLGIAFVLLMPVSILSVYTSNLFQGTGELLQFNFIRAMTPLTYATCLVGLYCTHRGSLAPVIVSQLAGYIVALVVGSAMVWRILRPRLQWNASAVPLLASYGCRIQGLSVATYLNQRVDQLVLSLLVPPQQLGLYAAAVTLSTAVTVFPQAAGIVAFSKGSGQRSDQAKVTIGVAFRSSLIWLLVCCSLLYVLAPFLIHVLFGAAFNGSILACRILLPGALMVGLNQVLYNGASALGRPLLPSFAESASIAITAIGLYLLTPRFGYIGAAVVSSIAYTLSFVVMLVLMHTLLGVTLRDLVVGRPTGRESVSDECST